MKSKKDTVASLLQEFLYHFDVNVVFDDFLTLTICAFGMNPITKKSYDEELYLQTIEKYKQHELRHHFPKLLAALVMEMEEQLGSTMGNDVLGTWYEQNYSKKPLGQFFTPWPICTFMSECLTDDQSEKVLRIIDPCCGSGRMLVCGAIANGRHHNYYGIDIDYLCVKMAAINLFLNGIFHAEIMCADALSPDDFRCSYKLSFLPFGIFRTIEKEKSLLWHSYKESFIMREKVFGPDLKLPSESDSSDFKGNASQLSIF